ncbi:uncharacterized protein LOC131170223 [Hevea brasiliensis]|uniref:uncharacterized protein LOC131170223 n=1 Tax=Hevea brasiliensis TaxID=3981 RepID=UPI0025F9E368|nr:uncharacterized protein LOC131170223 [Hevea brasiliensis]
MRQFGLAQPIPAPPMQTDELHDITLRLSESNWAHHHATYIHRWNRREQYIVQGQQMGQPLHHHSEYMEWYRRAGRRWISISGAAIGCVEDAIEDCLIKLQNPSTQNVAEVKRTLRKMMIALEQESRLCQMPPPQSAPQAATFNDELEEDQPINQPGPHVDQHDVNHVLLDVVNIKCVNPLHLMMLCPHLSHFTLSAWHQRLVLFP